MGEEKVSSILYTPLSSGFGSWFPTTTLLPSLHISDCGHMLVSTDAMCMNSCTFAELLAEEREWQCELAGIRLGGMLACGFLHNHLIK
jgi:hypothetical protein